MKKRVDSTPFSVILYIMNYDNCEHEYMELKSQFHAENLLERFVDEINDKVIMKYDGLSIDDFPDFDFDNLFDSSVEEGTRGWEYMIESAFEEYCLDHLAYARFLG
jgi:hypothetical protein